MRARGTLALSANRSAKQLEFVAPWSPWDGDQVERQRTVDAGRTSEGAASLLGSTSQPSAEACSKTYE